jgi:hypothetical protein
MFETELLVAPTTKTSDPAGTRQLAPEAQRTIDRFAL